MIRLGVLGILYLTSGNILGFYMKNFPIAAVAWVRFSLS
jgi:hypothetical protein